MGEPIVAGKSRLPVSRARAMFDVGHYNATRAAAELDHLRAVLARCAPAQPVPTPRCGRAYGPHDDASAPVSVVVGRGPHERTLPVPRAVLDQRRRINELAHLAGLASYPPGVS